MLDIFFKLFNDGPDDPLRYAQWHLNRIFLPDAWNICTGDTNIIVAVIDTDVEYNHPDLIDNKYSFIEYDCVDDDYDPDTTDHQAHATAVAGIIGAWTFNLAGVCGVAGGWSNCTGVRLMYFRTARSDSGISASRAAKAIDTAVAYGARIINMSFGAQALMDVDPWIYVKAAIDSAVNRHNVVCIASAGNYTLNSSDSSVREPASLPEVIAVGATDTNDIRKFKQDSFDWGSCYGPELDIVAPGVNIVTTDESGDSCGYHCTFEYTLPTRQDPVAYFDGTSASAPMVSGVCALMLSLNNNLTPYQVRKTLHLSADKVPAMGGSEFSTEYGYGRLNAYKAVRNIYVPTVHSVIDSGFAVIRQGQAIVLEAQSGKHILVAPAMLPANTVLEIHPGDTLLVRDTLLVDSTAVVWMFSDSTGQAVIAFEEAGLAAFSSPPSLRGDGSISAANMRWTGNFQVAEADTFRMKNGGLLDFTSDSSAIHINGALEFGDGEFVFADNLGDIIISQREHARFEVLSGTTLDNLPDITGYMPSNIISNCEYASPCYWLFRDRARLDAYRFLEARNTTLSGSQSGSWRDNIIC